MVTMRLTPILSVLVASWNIVSLDHKSEIVQLFKKDSFWLELWLKQDWGLGQEEWVTVYYVAPSHCIIMWDQDLYLYFGVVPVPFPHKFCVNKPLSLVVPTNSFEQYR